MTVLILTSKIPCSLQFEAGKTQKELTPPQTLEMKRLQSHKIDDVPRLRRVGANFRLADAVGAPLWRAVLAALLPRYTQRCLTPCLRQVS